MKFGTQKITFGLFLLLSILYLLPHFPIFAQTIDSVDAVVKIAICGNLIIEKPAEECEGLDLDGESCESLGFQSGTLSCDISCGFETLLCVPFPPPACGDGSVDPGEECDGSDLGGETCESLGFQSGTLSCDIACEFETALCVPFPVPSCGDGTLDAGEECEVGDPVGSTCEWSSCNETTCVCEEEEDDEPPTLLEDLFIGPGEAPPFVSILPDALVYFDLNGDGIIQESEIGPAVELWVNIWRNVLYDENDVTCDLNNDGKCDIYDFSILMYYIGK